MPLFTAGVFFIGFLALLLAGFNAMLSPLKDNQRRMEAELDNMKKDIYEIKIALVSSSTTKILPSEKSK